MWFSASLRLVVLIESAGAADVVTSVVVFQADDWSSAHERALELGRGQESSYIGGTGEAVQWRLEKVETLDLLGEGIEDGREVYSQPGPVPEELHVPLSWWFFRKAS